MVPPTLSRLLPRPRRRKETRCASPLPGDGDGAVLAAVRWRRLGCLWVFDGRVGFSLSFLVWRCSPTLRIRDSRGVFGGGTEVAVSGAERPVRPESALVRGRCRAPVRSPQHERPVGARFHRFPRTGGGSGRFGSDGYGGGDAAGAGGEAVPVCGGQRRGASGALGERTRLASGGHPSRVTQGQPQSGPGGKRASAPLPPCRVRTRLSQTYLAGFPLAPRSARPTGGHAPLPSPWLVCPHPLPGSLPLCERLPQGRRCRSGTPGIAAEAALPPIPEGSTAAAHCGAWAAAETSPKGGAASPAPRGQVGVGGGPLIAIGGQLPWHLFSWKSVHSVVARD